MRTQDCDKDVANLDQSAVMELASAIARGDACAASTALDVAFRDFPTVGEWIAQARASRASHSGQGVLAHV